MLTSSQLKTSGEEGEETLTTLHTLWEQHPWAADIHPVFVLTRTLLKQRSGIQTECVWVGFSPPFSPFFI